MANYRVRLRSPRGGVTQFIVEARSKDDAKRKLMSEASFKLGGYKVLGVSKFLSKGWEGVGLKPVPLSRNRMARRRTSAGGGGGIRAMVRRLPDGRVQVKIPAKRNPEPQERYFKRKDAAERFKRLMQAHGLYASVFEEPTDAHAGTRRKRAHRTYKVVYGDPFE